MKRKYRVLALAILLSSSLNAQPLPPSSYKSVKITPADTIKYYRVADDFLIDIGDKKAFPSGYIPYWDVVDKVGPVTFNVTKHDGIGDYDVSGKDPSGKTFNSVQKAMLWISEIDHKAYLKMSGFGYTCDCAARLLKDGEAVVITDQPQTFYLDDFYKYQEKTTDYWSHEKATVVTSNPCKRLSGAWYDPGGWRMSLTISRDNNSALLVNAMVQSIITQQNLIARNGSDAGKTFTGKMIFPNRVTADFAKSIVKKDEEKKKADIAADIADRQARAEAEKVFELSIKDSYAKVAKAQNINDYTPDRSKCLHTYNGFKSEKYMEREFYPVSVPTGELDANGYPITRIDQQSKDVKKFRDVPSLMTENRCNFIVSIKGVKKLESARGTIYFEDASIEIDPNVTIPEEIKVEANYNPKTAEIGSTHYYINKLPPLK